MVLGDPLEGVGATALLTAAARALETDRADGLLSDPLARSLAGDKGFELLSRLAYRVIWLNPLKEDPAYEPLARGMHAALPHVDVFLSGHNLASLEALGRSL